MVLILLCFIFIKEFLKSFVIKGMVEMVSGIMFALELMFVLIKKRDKGRSKIMRMIKGKE